ncbi:capsule biosynthesis protein [Herbaspirillum rubrisubalbicans]|uniref:capsule biosynthesis protein n=1 Tax=Herbaspirillum rubrisubalbicans TaxID=80842 RepID=UPI000A9F0BB6|nr:capsular biosynthesis protein [Herbaspirillum rubrisubalbicans]
MKRNFLMLQGPASPFFARLAQRLRQDGHHVHRIHFCAGDALHTGASSTVAFRGKPDTLPVFLAQQYARHHISDQLLFGDQRPLHRLAVEQARKAGVRNHVFEEGYFRPYWITLEREGVNACSLLPRDPRWYLATAARLPELPVPTTFNSPFSHRALHDITYHAAGAANPLLFPAYRNHAGITAATEYAAYVRRFSKLWLMRQREEHLLDQILASSQPRFVLPLQLNTDAQIQAHSTFAHMGQVIDLVMTSFARHAAPQAILVIKNHPLDPGCMDHARLVARCQERLGLDGRVYYLEQADLSTLLAGAAGMVTVNSTAGLVALQNKLPTHALSTAIYRLPGLTHMTTLDHFWQEPPPPDPLLFDAFRRCVLHTTQLNGGFHCAAGIAMAVEHAAHVVCAARSPLEELQ